MLFSFNLRGFRDYIYEKGQDLPEKKKYYTIKIKNINAHLTILDKHIKEDSIRHNVVSEYDDFEICIYYNYLKY